MIQTSEKVNDKQVIAQLLKSCQILNLSVGKIGDSSYDVYGYLERPTYLGWSGSEADGAKIQDLIETFGYETDWNGDRAMKIGIIPKFKNI